MKTLTLFVLMLLPISLIVPQAQTFSTEKKSSIVDNLTTGIESENAGLREGSANVLSDLIADSYLKPGDASRSMIPLLVMLENGNTDEERIAAALALFDLGHPIGIYRLRDNL